MRATALFVIGMACALAAQAAERLPDRRVQPAPVISTSSGVTREQLLELSSQLDSLQGQLRQLQNQIETQGHELEQLKNRQRGLFDDMDKRLRRLEQGGGRVDAAPAVPTSVPKASAEEQRQYDTAFQALKQGDYEKAIKGFRDFVARYPQSPLAGHAQYWLGEANYVLHKPSIALDEFNKVVQRYPQSQKVPDALLKIGFVQQELGAHAKARKAYDDVIRRYPDSAAAKLAEKRLEKLPQ